MPSRCTARTTPAIVASCSRPRSVGRTPLVAVQADQAALAFRSIAAGAKLTHLWLTQCYRSLTSYLARQGRSRSRFACRHWGIGSCRLPARQVSAGDDPLAHPVAGHPARWVRSTRPGAPVSRECRRARQMFRLALDPIPRRHPIPRLRWRDRSANRAQRIGAGLRTVGSQPQSIRRYD